MLFRRIRGMVIRLVRRRLVAVTLGIALAAPAVWFEFGGRSDRWWIGGLSLICAATGMALIWAGASGIGPDWVDPGS
jgi:hypothetical protein